MAKRITRTIKTTTVSCSVIHEDADGSTYLAKDSYTLPGVLSVDEAQKELHNRGIIAKVDYIGYAEKLYAMSVDTFLENASIIEASAPDDEDDDYDNEASDEQ